MKEKRMTCPFGDALDCFARTKTTRTCKILLDTNFGGRPCPFYKSKAQYDADQAGAVALMDLDEEEDEDEESD